MTILCCTPSLQQGWSSGEITPARQPWVIEIRLRWQTGVVPRHTHTHTHTDTLAQKHTHTHSNEEEIKKALCRKKGGKKICILCCLSVFHWTGKRSEWKQKAGSSLFCQTNTSTSQNCLLTYNMSVYIHFHCTQKFPFAYLQVYLTWPLGNPLYLSFKKWKTLFLWLCYQGSSFYFQ